MVRTDRSLATLAGIAAVVGAAVIAPDAAFASAVIDVSVMVAGETPTTVYGSSTAEGPQIPVSTTTTLFEVDLGRVSDTDCSLTAATGERLAAEEWYGQGEDDDGIRRFSIPGGVLADGGRYTVRCRDGNFTSRTIAWNVIGTATRTGTVERLLRDPAVITRSEVDQNVYAEDAIPPVVAGDLVRLTGPAATWDVGGVDSVTVGDVPASASVSGDGSTLEFIVPRVSPGPAVLRANTTTTVPGTPVRVSRTIFYGSLEIVPEAAIDTSTALSLSAGRVAFTKARATVEVVTSDGSSLVGEVVITGDGYVISRAEIAATDAGRVVITLPRLTRGQHVIVASFRPTGAATPSTSTPTRLRQLI